VEFVADQPSVVQERITHFNREFGIAILSVILVTMLLLPLRVAAIAAIAIPVTVLVTFALMNAFGIELHQVSIAALIVVLGMVVDDAIVIADNYVELLDQGVQRPEAAWRSAGDLAVPVLTATLTIIASFLPLAFLTGTVGEFIRALPVTVTIALLCSFVVAMVLTPLACRTLIRFGLHNPDAARKSSKRRGVSPLDAMQALYERALRWAMPRRALTLTLAAATFLVGLGMIHRAPNRFFPPAERDQFVVDLWLPEGTRIEATDETARRIEATLRSTRHVRQVAAFVGSGAPRFYYNVSPEYPAQNYAQLLVRSDSPEATTELVRELRPKLQRLAPEAQVLVKELEQGAATSAPIEIRIVGQDLGVLESTGRTVQTILERTPGSTYTSTDYKNDVFRLALDVDTDRSSRLGLTNANVAKELAWSFEGTPISTFWEGSRPVNIVARLDDAHRETFEDVATSEIASGMTGRRVPVLEVANLRPDWGPGRVVRRNGVRTLTVRAFAQHGHLASEILALARPQIDALTLPAGYRIEYGGEYEDQKESFSEMMKALAVSELLIFLILMLQFRSLVTPLIVMTSIPLALVGSGLGLILTGNPFSFTAFLGLISLTGVVVRNAIILVDYMNEERAKGIPVEQAAMDAGRRRLRPIFLTSSAAAVGVLPMILSGSGMWSPLASVIAVGLLCSMVFTLIVVPVLYVVVNGRKERASAVPVRFPAAAAACIAAALLATASQARAEAAPVSLTLPQAVAQALERNPGIHALQCGVAESRAKVFSAKASYLPELKTEVTYQGTSDRHEMTISRGSLGDVPGLGPFPTEDVRVAQGRTSVFLGSATLTQPLTPLYKLNQAEVAASADARTAVADLSQAREEIALAVHRIYFGLLVAQRQREAAVLRSGVAEQRAHDASTAVSVGDALPAIALQGKTAALEAEQKVLALDDQIADLEASLAETLALPVGTRFELAAPGELTSTELPSLETCVRSAVARNPEVTAAEQLVSKAQAGLGTAYAAYVPDIALFARYTYQDGISMLSQDDVSFGIKAEWTVFDFGKRESTIGQRMAKRESARANLASTKNRITVETTKAWRAVERARRSAELADEVYALRMESARVRGDESETGVVLAVEQQDSKAALASSDADRLGARLNLWLARLDLERWMGGSQAK